MSSDIEQIEIPESPNREAVVASITSSSVETSQSLPVPPQDSVQEVAVDIKTETKKTNVIQEFETFSPIEKWDDENETLNIPGGNIDAVRATINDGPNIRLDDSEVGRKWSESLRESVDTLNIRGVLDRTVARENAEFQQYIKSEKMPLAAGVPNLKFNNGEKVSGERAVLRIRSLLGLGTVLQIPLWHSGFWITIKAPDEASLLELQRRLISEKINLGRNTHGLVFANTSVYIASWLIDFVLAHIYDSTIKGTDIDYRKLIRVLDLPAIIWGLACTVWPNGFQYARACVADPEKCNHIVREKLNLGKLLWVDRKSLSDWQINHMTNRGGSSMSMESVERYLAEFTISNGRSITVNDNLTITFKVPNIEEYVNSGYKWVNNVVQMIDTSLTSEPNDTVRNVHITELGRATNMRQYAHWIESIDGAGSLVDDSESIEKIVDTLSAVDDIRKQYFDEVIKFIEDSTMAVVAVPSYECPKCQEAQPAPLPRFPHLLPIDVMSIFFTLLVQKLQKIHSR